MKQIAFSLAFFALFSLLGLGQPSTPQLAEKYFPKENLMPIGVYYYPEAWPQNQWERDINNIKKMGFEFIHMAEFAWAFMEPSEGKFDFTWLDKAVNLSHKAGLKIILCTPTPAPPVWLTRAHPDILIADEEGHIADHGTRTHGSFSSRKYRDYVTKIVTKLAERYGNDKRIWGWQIDNEPSHYGIIDYGKNPEREFPKWLKNKYGTIDKLNEVWGTSFWSQVYTSFEQITLPNQRISGQTINPHAHLDFRRFTADETDTFLKIQYDILKKFAGDRQWITSNYMEKFLPTDPQRSNYFDVSSYTMYPVSGWEQGKGAEGFRVGSRNKITYANDFYRPITAGGKFGIMELQPGQVNWGKYHPMLYPNIMKAWLFTAFGGGANFVCSYRYRQPLTGGEQYHYGMVKPDGVTPNVGGIEFGAVSAEMKKLRKLYNPNAKMPAEWAKRRVAIVHNPDNWWYQEKHPQTNQWNYFDHFLKVYDALKNLACPVDVIRPEQLSFAKYPTVVLPAYQLISKGFAAALERYASEGGNVIFTCRSGQMNENGHLWEGPYAEPVAKLAGVELAFYDHLPTDVQGTISMDGKEFKWNNWADMLKPNAGTNSLATYTSEFYKKENLSALTYRKLGKGSVAFIGADTDDEVFAQMCLRKIFNENKISFDELPEGVRLEYRDGFFVAVNYQAGAKTISLPKGAKVVYGKPTLEMAEVCIFMLE